MKNDWRLAQAATVLYLWRKWRDEHEIFDKETLPDLEGWCRSTDGRRLLALHSDSNGKIWPMLTEYDVVERASNKVNA